MPEVYPQCIMLRMDERLDSSYINA